MSNIPQVLLLVEDFYLIHVILLVNTGLNLEHVVRISDVLSQTFRHGADILEQIRIDFLICLRYWILIVYYIEIHISVIRVNRNLDGVPYVIRRTHLS